MGMNELKELYYTGEEARKILGMTRDAFDHYVRSGQIEGTILFGKQRSYEKKLIDTMKARFDSLVLAAQVPSIHFERATLATLAKELELSERTWGEQTRQYHPYRQAMLEKNPEMSYYLFDGEMLGASINIVPLSKEGIERFKQGERGWLLGAYVIPYAPGEPLSCIIIDMMSTPLVPIQRRTSYAVQLFSKMEDVFADFGKRGVEIDYVYANGGTDQGRRLLHSARFQKIHVNGQRVIYELFVQDSSLGILSGYRRELDLWKRRQKK